MIYVENKKKKTENILKVHPNAVIIDITSKGKGEAQYLSPFYPHHGIPVPFSGKITGACVEGIWQGLKVFETEDVNLGTIKNDTMKNLKRTVRTLGVPRGHRKGIYGTELLGYIEARIQIYLPTYKWVLDNIPAVHNYLMKLKQIEKERDIVFLDYATNLDIMDEAKPLSHAGLVKLYLEDRYPLENGEIPAVIRKPAPARIKQTEEHVDQITKIAAQKKQQKQENTKMVQGSLM